MPHVIIKIINDGKLKYVQSTFQIFDNYSFFPWTAANDRRTVYVFYILNDLIRIDPSNINR